MSEIRENMLIKEMSFVRNMKIYEKPGMVTFSFSSSF
jgi:hypothetical protein